MQLCGLREKRLAFTQAKRLLRMMPHAGSPSPAGKEQLMMMKTHITSENKKKIVDKKF